MLLWEVHAGCLCYLGRYTQDAYATLEDTRRMRVLPSSPAVKWSLYSRFGLRGDVNDFRVRHFARPGCDGLRLRSPLFNQLRGDSETHGSIRIRTVVDENDFLAAQVFSAPYRPAYTEVFQHRFGVCLRSFPRHSNRGGNIGGIERVGEAKFSTHGSDGRAVTKN